jgi:hypothetical protein
MHLDSGHRLSTSRFENFVARIALRSALRCASMLRVPALVFHVGDKDYRTPHRDRRRLSKVERFDRSFRGRSFENGPLSERKGATQFPRVGKGPVPGSEGAGW